MDPSVFNLNLTVLRPDDGGAMMRLVKYDLEDGTAASAASASDLIHNHVLTTAN